MEGIERSRRAGGALQGSGEWTLLMGWMERCGCKGACGFGCEQHEEGAEEGGEKQGFVLTSVEMLKNELNRRVPVWGLSGLERESWEHGLGWCRGRKVGGSSAVWDLRGNSPW